MRARCARPSARPRCASCASQLAAHHGGRGLEGLIINISQMIACLGQQAVDGKRIQDGFVRRTLRTSRRAHCGPREGLLATALRRTRGDRVLLPHDGRCGRARATREPRARAHARAVSALSLSLSHSLSLSRCARVVPVVIRARTGREGLVDTAVRPRRRAGAAADEGARGPEHAVRRTVRNSETAVVQPRYGDDGLNPTAMEGADRPSSSSACCSTSSYDRARRRARDRPRRAARVRRADRRGRRVPRAAPRRPVPRGLVAFCEQRAAELDARRAPPRGRRRGRRARAAAARPRQRGGRRDARGGARRSRA